MAHTALTLLSDPANDLAVVEYAATADDFDDEGCLLGNREWSETRTGYVTREVSIADAEWMLRAEVA